MNSSQLAEKLAKLEDYLSEHKVVWVRLDCEGYTAAFRQWVSVFGNAFCRGMRYREGAKARLCLSQVTSNEFVVVSANNCPHHPFCLTSEHRIPFGYKCIAKTVPDLSAFSELEIAVIDSEFAWTMAYTHEDDSMGGPYFALRSWLGPPKEELTSHARRRIGWRK